MLGFARRKKKDTFASNITIVVREYTPNPDETLHVSYQAQSSKSITYDFDESGDQDYVTCFDVKYELKRMGGYFERAKNDRVFQLFVQTKSGEKRNIGDPIVHDLAEVSPYKHDNEVTSYTHTVQNLNVSFCFETSLKQRKGALISATASSMKLRIEDARSPATERDFSDNESDNEVVSPRTPRSTLGSPISEDIGSPRGEETQKQIDDLVKQIVQLKSDNRRLDRMLKESTDKSKDLEQQLLKKSEQTLSPALTIPSPTATSRSLSVTSPRDEENKKNLYQIIEKTQNSLDELTRAYKEDTDKLLEANKKLVQERDQALREVKKRGESDQKSGKMRFTLQHYEHLNSLLEVMEKDFFKMRKLISSNEDSKKLRAALDYFRSQDSLRQVVNEQLIDVLRNDQEPEDPVSRDQFKRFKACVANILRCFSLNNDIVHCNIASLGNDMVNPVIGKLVEQLSEAVSEVLEAKLKPGVLVTVHPWTFVDVVRQRIKSDHNSKKKELKANSKDILIYNAMTSVIMAGMEGRTLNNHKQMTESFVRIALNFKFLSEWFNTLRSYEDIVTYYYAEGSVIGNHTAMDNIAKSLAFFNEIPFKLTLYSKEAYYFNLLNSRETPDTPDTPRTK